MSERLFVYGTLRPHLAPPGLRVLLAEMRSLGSASVAGRLHDFGAYPGAVLDPDTGGETRVHGELLELPEDPGLWDALDRYEGAAPGSQGRALFRRVRCPVRTQHGDLVEAWIYEYARDPGAAPRIRNGCYAAPGRAPERKQDG